MRARSIHWADLAMASLAAAPILILLLVIGGLIYLATTLPPSIKPQPKYYPSDMVEMVLSGDMGMVVKTYCHASRRQDATCTYSVRFSSLQLRTDTHIFASDGPVQFAPVSLVHGIKEFELRSAR